MIDGHVHVLPDRVRAELDAVRSRDAWFGVCHGPRARVASEHDLLAALDESGFDRALCFTWPFADPELCREANDWLAAVVRRHPGRLEGFASVNPADPGAAAEARRALRLGLRGIGELNADAQGFSLDGPEVDALAAASVELRVPWNLHCSEPVGHAYPGKGTATPDALWRFVERHPDLRLVCAHLGGGLPFYAHMPEVLERCRSLWFDTAALPYLYAASALRQVVEMCGAGQVVFGSDFPLLRAERSLPIVAEAVPDPADRAAVLGGTLAALLEGA